MTTLGSEGGTTKLSLPFASPSAGFAKFAADDAAKWAKVILAAHIKQQ